MSLVGDPIIRLRQLAPDRCATLLTPTLAAPTPTAQAGGTLSGALYFVLTWLTSWGETAGSIEATATVSGANNAVSVANAVPPGASSGRIYVGTAPGAENQWFPASLTGTTVLTSLSGGTAGVPPISNRAWLPDTDGPALGAFQAYDWLNKGLDALCLLAGGILDENGVAIPKGAAEFVLPGRWLKLIDHWYDGWFVVPERQMFTWMKSTVSGIPGIVTLWKNAAQQIMGMWPQAGNTFATSTLSAAAAIGDTFMSLVNSANFIAPGLALVDAEVFSFTSIADANGNNNQLGLLVRGLGGSVAAAHSLGATVNQLIYRFRGYRFAAIYSVGNSGLTLDVPAGWDEPLDLYMLSKFKEYEQDRAAAKELMGEFQAMARQWAANSDSPDGPRQLGNVMPFVGDTENLEQMIGTILVP